MKMLILEVKKSESGPQIVASRAHPDLVKRLFEMEVPEITEKVVEIKAVAREVGERSKIAVLTGVENVDPVGACVGVRGARVKNVVRELRGEKIDIVRWSADALTLISNVLSPAKVTNVTLDSDKKAALVTVSDDQLSLAIGKKGQNVRLAANLTGWKIDIKSESQCGAGEALDLRELPGVGEKTAERLQAAGFKNLQDIAGKGQEALLAVKGIGAKTVARIWAEVEKRGAAGEKVSK